jgi:hypothetical protein
LPLLGGVPVNDEAYSFFLNRGYRGRAQGILEVMTQNTTRFRMCAECVNAAGNWRGTGSCVSRSRVAP